MLVHKTANVLDKLPKSVQPQAKQRLQAIWMAPDKARAALAFDLLAYEGKYPKAADCLAKDREVLLTFYYFLAEHWGHIRTTNPVESTFATVRLRTDKTRWCLSRNTMLAMVFKLCLSAQQLLTITLEGGVGRGWPPTWRCVWRCRGQAVGLGSAGGMRSGLYMVAPRGIDTPSDHVPGTTGERGEQPPPRIEVRRKQRIQYLSQANIMGRGALQSRFPKGEHPVRSSRRRPTL